LTLIHITDLHGRKRFLNGPLHRLINKWQPDLVCVTGDLVQHRGQLDRVMGEIGRIRAREGIFFVPGNYEREEKRVIGKKRYTDQEYGHTHGGQSQIVRQNMGGVQAFSRRSQARQKRRSFCDQSRAWNHKITWTLRLFPRNHGVSLQFRSDFRLVHQSFASLSWFVHRLPYIGRHEFSTMKM
ncbi:MAG TPA: metallophosphoesterase, partial [Brevibacillus sp.]|nr:metallophosphoesterase [Brevibacillus sp.]